VLKSAFPEAFEAASYENPYDFISLVKWDKSLPTPTKVGVLFYALFLINSSMSIVIGLDKKSITIE
jgi:hypothetical protein